MSDDHIKYVTVKRSVKKKSGYSVEERDGEYFVSEAPAKARVNVGDKIVTINGITDEEFTDEDDANGLIESIRIVVIPADEVDAYDAAVNAEGGEEEEEEGEEEEEEEENVSPPVSPKNRDKGKAASNPKDNKKKKGDDSDEDSDYDESDKRGKGKGKGKKGAAAAAAAVGAGAIVAAVAAQDSDNDLAAQESDDDEEAPESHALVVRENVGQCLKFQSLR